MYLVAIGWLYVAFMMALAQAMAPNGSLIGALFTFLLYGVGPTALLMYILGTPGRKRRRALREAASAQHDAGDHAPAAGSVAPEAEQR